MNKKITAIFICFLLVLASVTEAFAITEYSKSGFDYGEQKKIAEMSLIMRVGCTECYVNNQRDSFETFPENVKPYEMDGGIYVPLEFTLNSLGIDTVVNDDNSISAAANGKTLTLDENSGGKVERRDAVLYADAEHIAETFGVYCREYKTTVVLSKNKEVTEISDRTVEELGELLGYNWRNAYLGSLGYVTDFMNHPKNKELVYCMTDVGGFYLFDKTKEKWAPMMDGIPDTDGQALPLRSMALDPNDDKVIYTSGGGNWYDEPHYLLKTTDRGKSWTKLDFPGNTSNAEHSRLVGSDIAVDPNDSNTVFAGSYMNGLFVSHDGGISWDNIASIPAEQCTEVPSGTSHILIDGREKLSNGRSKVMYAGVLGRGVYKSEDGGESFKLIEGSPIYPCRFQLVGDKLYISATSNPSRTVAGGFFCYENGALTDLSPNKEVSDKFYMAFMVDYTDPNMIIVVKAPYRDTDTIYRSYDGGKTWEDLGVIRNPTTILQDPENPQGIWWPYGAGIYYVSDKDASKLSKVDRDVNVEELVVTEVVSIPSKNAPALHSMVMDHGHMLSENIYDKATANKPYMGKGTALDYCSEDPSLVIRAGFVQNDPYGDTLLAVSEDYGRTLTATAWDKNNTVIDAVAGAKKQANGKPLLMVVTYGDSSNTGRGIWRSKDFGNTWEMCGDMVTGKEKWNYTTQPLAADRVNPNVYYFLEDKKLYRTMDGGDNWSCIYSLPNYEGTTNYKSVLIKTIPGVEGGLWIRHGNEIYATYDYGKTMQKINARDVTMFGFGCGKQGSKLPTAYMWGTVNGVFGLYISDDLGESWRKINDSTHNTQNLIDMCGDANVYGRVYMATSSRGVICATPVEVDDSFPSITLETKSSEPSPLSVNYAIGSDAYEIKGKVSKRSEVRVNGKPAEVDGYNNFSITVELSEGENNFVVEAESENGQHAEPVELMLRHVTGFKGGEGDTEPPLLTVSAVPETTEQKLYALKGSVNESADVMVNHKLITVNEELKFINIISLEEGENVIRVQARDLAKNACAPQEYKITYVPNKTADTSKFDSKHTPSDFVLDGNVEKYAALNKYMDKLAFGEVSVAAKFDTMWDESYLYVAARVTDDIIYNSNATSHNNDCIEVYIDGDNCKGKSYNEHDKQYVFDVDTSGLDKDCKFTVTDEGYDVELRIPWSELGVTPQSGMKIGFDIDCVDNDSQYITDGPRKGAVVWHGTDQDWTDPSVFATITLIK